MAPSSLRNKRGDGNAQLLVDLSEVLLWLYSGAGMLWILAMLAEEVSAVESLADDFMVNVLSDVVVAAAGFSLAIVYGNRIVEYFDERRRLDRWKNITSLCAGRVFRALVGHFASTTTNTPLLSVVTATDATTDAVGASYRLWTAKLRTLHEKILPLGTAAQLGSALTPEESTLLGLMTGAWRNAATELQELLRPLIEHYSAALPDDFLRAIAKTTLQLDRFLDQCKAPKEHDPAVSYVLLNNLQHGIELLDSLAELSAEQQHWNWELVQDEGRTIVVGGRKVVTRAS